MTSEEPEKQKNEIELNENKEENIQAPSQNENLDFKELYYSQPSQKDKVKKDFTEYSQIDMSLLNKKRERTTEKEEEEHENNNKLGEDQIMNNNEEVKKEEKIEIIEIGLRKKEEEIKENDLENNLPKELLDLIEERKNKEPFTLEDFEKYKAYKKLNVNFSKQS